MRRTKVEWMGIVENYRSSGLTVHRFCKSEGIAEQSLRNWITRTEKSSGSEMNHGFVEVRPIRAPDKHDISRPSFLDLSSLRHGITIRFPEGSSIEVYPDTDRSTLEWVLSLMAKRT